MFEVLDLKDIIEIRLAEGCYIFLVKKNVQSLIIEAPTNVVIGETNHYTAFSPNDKADFYYLIVEEGYEGEFNSIDDPEHRKKIYLAYSRYVSDKKAEIIISMSEKAVTRNFQVSIGGMFSECEIKQIIRFLKRKADNILRCKLGDKPRMILPSLKSGLPGKAFRAFTAIGFDNEISNYFKELVVNEKLFPLLVHDFLMDLIVIRNPNFEYPIMEEFYNPDFEYTPKIKPYYWRGEEVSSICEGKGGTTLSNNKIAYVEILECWLLEAIRFAGLLSEGYSKERMEKCFT